MNNIPEEYSDEEINLLDYWRVIWKWKYFIILLVFITSLTSAIHSLSKIDIFQATAIISPLSEDKSSGGLSILTQQLGGLPGISLPPSTSVSEIMNLFNSNMIREKMIERYDLFPILFPDRWDKEKKEWKKEVESGFSLNPFLLIKNITELIKPKKINSNPLSKKDSSGPSLWDGLRTLNSIYIIKSKENTISISAEFPNPEMTVNLVNYIISTLTEHISSEAKQSANIKRRYLEEQLRTTADPIIRQKIYTLISQQVETAMMSEMKEEFAFKVIDPARVPDRRIRPDRSQTVLLSIIVSFFLGIFLAFFFEYILKKL